MRLIGIRNWRLLAVILVGAAFLYLVLVIGQRDSSAAFQGNIGTGTVSIGSGAIAQNGGLRTFSITTTSLTTPAISLFGDGADNDGDGLIDEDLIIGHDEDGDCPGDTNGDGHVCRIGDQGVDEDPVNGIDDDYKIGGGEGGGDPSNCFDLIDNDSDGLVDIDDPDCQGDGVADEDPPPGQIGSDDDKDGREGASSPLGTCDDQIDNDADGLVDINDPDCAGKIDEDPVDGIDNDGDGLIDEDPRNEDGDGSEFGGRYPQNCSDGIDNDGDGFIDDSDPECQPYIDEDGGQDDDGDGLVDEDGIDDDRDGLIDEDGPAPCLVDPFNPFAGTQDCGLGAYQIKVSYDATSLTLESIENGTFLTSNGRIIQLCSTSTGVGSITFSCSTAPNLAQPSTRVGPEGSGVLAHITFSENGVLGDVPLTLTGTKLLDVASRPLVLTLNAGTARVIECADVPTGDPPAYDGTIGITTDVVEELAHAGTSSSDPDWLTHEPYDVNNDGGVGITTDVVHMLSLVGQSCTAS